MINVDLFEDGERHYINRIAEGRDREKLSRQDILSAVSFAREVADDTDMDIISWHMPRLLTGCIPRLTPFRTRNGTDLNFSFHSRY